MILLIKVKLNGLVETHLQRISYNDQTLNKQSGEIFHLQKISLLYVCIVCMRHLKSNNYAGYDCSLCSLVSTDHIFPGARENSSHKTQVTTTALRQACGCDS